MSAVTVCLSAQQDFRVNNILFDIWNSTRTVSFHFFIVMNGLRTVNGLHLI